MATVKQSRSSSSQRARRVPVRVVKSARPRRSAPPPEPIPVRKPVRRPIPRQANRRMLMWTGVIVVTTAIFILWLGIARSNLSQPSASDSFFGKIFSELSDFFEQFKPFKAPEAATNENPELEDLRDRVFPEIKDQKFSTSNDNQNVNAASPSSGNTVNTNATQ